LLILYNKWDLVGEREEAWKRLGRERSERYPDLGDVPALPVSATERLHLHRLPALLRERADQGRRRIPTPELNRWLAAVQRQRALPANREGRTARLYYATQTGIQPPQFTVFANHPSRVGQNYRRYLVARLAERFAFRGCPVRLHIRKSE
jgi:GTP-binding protein